MKKVTQKFVMSTPLFKSCLEQGNYGALSNREKRRELANALKKAANTGSFIIWDAKLLSHAFLWEQSIQGHGYWLDWNCLIFNNRF